MKHFKRIIKFNLYKRMFVAGFKKLLGIKSPSIMMVSKYEYEYDYFKDIVKVLKTKYPEREGQNKCVQL